MAINAVNEHVVLSDDPQRERLRRLQARIEEQRDAIAEVDFELETLRDQLAAFENFYHANLRSTHTALRRVECLLQHLERWSETLQARATVPAKAARLEERRARDVREHSQPAFSHAAEDANKSRRKSGDAQGTADDLRLDLAPPADTQAQLKDVYRSLARRFHPDLAPDERTRVRHSQVMARINALYRQGDLSGLVTLSKKARGDHVDDSSLSVAEQIALLGKRLAWFDTVLGNLRDERMALERSPTCELWRNAAQAKEAGRDIFAELREESAARVRRAYDDVPHAVHDLEAAVAKYNRQQTSQGLQKRSAQALEHVFDPFVDKSLVRLALDDLGVRKVSAAARRQANAIEALAAEHPALLRMVLFTAVSELSPYPLQGVESFDDLQLRYDVLAVQDEDNAPASLAEALVQLDAWLEFGVKRASQTLAHTGLRFVSDDVRQAVPLALRARAVRRQFKRVLGVLGEQRACSACGATIFAIPLFRLRGIDDLRASVCPACGETLHKYWMPRGKDVQAVLNATFVDYEIVSEWSFAFARASIATQLTPSQVENMTIGALKKQVIDDVFTRHALALKPSQVVIAQRGKAVPDRTPLASLEATRFRLQFRASAPMSEADALEMVRHRIRNRFKA